MHTRPAAGKGWGRAVMANCGSSTGRGDGAMRTVPSAVIGGMDGPPCCNRRAHANKRGPSRH
eukprot:4031978-Lingulodinium_polyedra.AAC.1